ncbi:PREDICTED: interactor of constitutive active ROPs 3-like [Camelina sativa]|uniref:Interactor of constitutive active ROPs 3-like n=1 Tax=Camelina sativa TaxID=90675 RepID=A0ABM0XFJ7_CAMSA|nr:PREDICTED: interactor of constitutive active ROPs 3-like [Camelina sativa]
MQTQKARNGSPDVPKKVSPRAVRSLKIGSLESESSSPPVSANNRTPKDKSPKVLDRRSPRSPVSEKKRPSRITELESLVSQLQEELKKAKDQVSVSETSKKQAEEEAEKSRKELQEVSSKFEENQNQFLEVSALEEETDNTNSLVHQGIISQECDLEFSATAGERAGLAAVAHEIRQLKLQIEMVASSEAGHVKQAELHNSEVQLLRGNLMDTIFLVESFRNQLTNCEVSEAETEAMATETLRQLENAKKAVEELKSDGTKTVESYKKMAVELQQSKSRMVWLEALVNKLQTNSEDLEIHETLLKDYESLKLGESNEREEEVSSLRCEVERLRAALEASDRKDQEGNVEASSRLRIQAELQSELKIASFSGSGFDYRRYIEEAKRRLKISILNGSPDVPKKVSPRAVRSLKIGSLESESSSPPVSANNRTPKDKSPKVLDRRSPRSPVSEKKRPSRITELESLVSQLQEELKKAKDQVSVSETSKKQAEEEAEKSRKELQEVSSKFEENQNQFLEVSALEEETDNTNSLVHQGIISQECDLEFSATAGERAGLAAVAHEIRQLKLQIEMVASSEAGHVKQAELHNSEVQLLRGNLMDTIFLVESFRNQLTNCEVSEAETEAMATETLRQLENAKKAVEELKSDGTKTVESYKKMAVELQQSKSRMVWLEALVNKLQTNSEDLEIHETLLKDYENVQDAFMKLGIAMEEADKSSKRAVRVTEQLEATQTSNSEMETELRKLKVQSNQWRKAAEAATAMLSAGNNGNYNQTNSPYSEDIDDELTKKKNGNVLKKIGVLWKKPQK